MEDQGITDGRRKNPRKILKIDVPLLSPDDGSIIARAADFSPDGMRIYSNQLMFTQDQLLKCWVDFPNTPSHTEGVVAVSLKIIWSAPDSELEGGQQAGALFIDLDAPTRLRLLEELDEFSSGIYR